MIRFGSLELKSNLFLSPLAGYTNLPFRRVVREIGAMLSQLDTQGDTVTAGVSQLPSPPSSALPAR